MATNLNNIHINSFTKGMNTDTSLDMVGNELYVFGLNIRITTNALLKGVIDSNSKEGILTPVPFGEETESTLEYDCILAVASIENIGAVIIKNKDNTWSIIRVINEDDALSFDTIFTSDEQVEQDRFDVVINKELGGEDTSVIKLYIVDGHHEMMIINIANTKENNEYLKKLTKCDHLRSCMYFPKKQITIQNKISGTLNTGQVLYTYRFYKKHGICSKLAPLTRKIQVIDANRNKQIGNAEDTQTTVGFKIKMHCDEEILRLFDHVEVYRLHYSKPHTDALIDLISDVRLSDITDFCINDSGLNSLLNVSIQEFASLNTIDVVPTCIEQNQGYLFVANTDDKTQYRVDNSDFDSRSFSFNAYNNILLFDNLDTTYSKNMKTFSVEDIDNIPSNYTLNKYADMSYVDLTDERFNCRYDKDKYWGGTGKNISWRFVCTRIPLSNNDSSKDYESAPSVNNNTEVLDVYYINQYGVLEKVCDQNALFESFGVCKPSKYSYDDLFVSSTLRSLKRDEVYRYGIVLYDKYGRRSDVKWIADIRTPDDYSLPMTHKDEKGNLYAQSIGIKFSVKNTPKDIIGYQIVRCGKEACYSKNLMQCVVSKPMRQPVYSVSETKYSPYYPSFLLSTQWQRTYVADGDNYKIFTGDNFENKELFQLFSPEIQLIQDDSISKLTSFLCKMQLMHIAYGNSLKVDNSEYKIGSVSEINPITILNNDRLQYLSVSRILFKDALGTLSVSGLPVEIENWSYDKQNSSFVMKYFDRYSLANNAICEIKDIQNVTNPTWEQGFSNIQLSGSDIISGIKQYKSFSTSISNYSYVNWVCNGMYDLRVSKKMSLPGQKSGDMAALVSGGRDLISCGYIGPGPRCFLACINADDNKIFNPNSELFEWNVKDRIYTYVVNIIHTPIQYAGLTDQDKQYDVYYGFGNYANIEDDQYVFDGDVYINNCEIVTMYKTYDFNSVDTIPSSQFIYYVPMESSINTSFDYGMCYKNTKSKNVQLEPGEISGVATQDRPEHQYNMIYSDNNVSNDVFNAQSIEDSVQKFTNRIHYSELKTNGEKIDKWGDFKAINYIDCDSRYGSLTNLLTSKDILYYWQQQAFGKLSVNERSLVTDNNSNTIQLGQGGVLQRTDYINTRYGMRENDHSAISAEGSVYWIDILNKAIVMSNGQSAVNMGEAVNVQSLLNKYISEDIPTIHYDLLNNELLCKCINIDLDNNDKPIYNDQIVFNLKLNIASSVYTRKYDNMIQFNNVLYGLLNNKHNKYNYINDITGYNTSVISFVVNPSASITKVFDDQEIVSLSRGLEPSDYFDGKTFKFTTNIIDETEKNPDGYTDREGNIRYAIPRYAGDYGYRMRGKWMKVDIEDVNPKYEHSISHILTKFRLSFS